MIASNRINLNSSRSHAIFTVHLETFDDTDLKVGSSRLVLVDLAGSERIDLFATNNNQKLREESININKSLFNLKKVMIALADGVNSPANTHVSFRDSKLTCLLQQSLGGSSSCLMVSFVDVRSVVSTCMSTKSLCLHFSSPAEQVRS